MDEINQYNSLTYQCHGLAEKIAADIAKLRKPAHYDQSTKKDMAAMKAIYKLLYKAREKSSRGSWPHYGGL